MNWIKNLFKKPEPKPVKELQAELKALCHKLQIGLPYESDLDQYEHLLKEIYLRGEEPEMKLTRGNI